MRELLSDGQGAPCAWPHLGENDLGAWVVCAYAVSTGEDGAPGKCPSPGMPWVALDMSWLLLSCLLDFPWASTVTHQSVHFMNRHKEYLFSWESPPGAVVYSKSPQLRPGIDLEPCICSKTALRHLPVLFATEVCQDPGRTQIVGYKDIKGPEQNFRCAYV